MPEPLDDSGWRVFRLLLRELPDRELQVVEQQLQCEMQHREACASSWARLLFTSLSAIDLQRAHAEIRYQQSERVEILRKLAEQSKAGRRNVRRPIRSKTRPQHKAQRA
jgi:hypothetical protein